MNEWPPASYHRLQEIKRLRALVDELAGALEAIDAGLKRYVATGPYSALLECREQGLERVRAEVRLALEKARGE
jgi:hypothetical protein